MRSDSWRGAATATAPRTSLITWRPGWRTPSSRSTFRLDGVACIQLARSYTVARFIPAKWPPTARRNEGNVVSERVVVITGASDGIGAAAARLLRARGDRVILVGRSAT